MKSRAMLMMRQLVSRTHTASSKTRLFRLNPESTCSHRLVDPTDTLKDTVASGERRYPAVLLFLCKRSLHFSSLEDALCKICCALSSSFPSLNFSTQFLYPVSLLSFWQTFYFSNLKTLLRGDCSCSCHPLSKLK